VFSVSLPLREDKRMFLDILEKKTKSECPEPKETFGTIPRDIQPE